MSAFVSGGQLILEGDGIGWNAGRRSLNAPPAGATGMCFAWRAWFESFTASFQDNSTPGWNHTHALGLKFGSDLLGASSRANFFGQANGAHSALPYAVQNLTNANIFGSGVTGSHFMIAPQIFPGTTATFVDASGGGIANDGAAVQMPSNATDGAAFTAVWLVRKTIASDSVLVSLGWNMEGLTDLLDARTSLGTTWQVTNATVTDSTNWRPGGAMAFPTHFIAQFPSPTSGRRMVVARLAVEYFFDPALVV